MNAHDLSLSKRALHFKFEERSIYSIIWSSLATIFACTWIAVHPNVPAQRDGALRVILRRFSIMIYLLIAPEMVILWAARQHYAARDLAKRYQDHGWTRTHAFFLVMGGFALYNPETNTFIRTLDPQDLDNLYASGQIAWPTVSAEQIEDRSKADFLAKSVVLLQTTWFIIGCLTRVGNKLPLTELEVITLAFASLNGVVYLLWWDKPMDVRCPVEVYLRTPQDAALQNGPIVSLDGGQLTEEPLTMSSNGISAFQPRSATLFSDKDATTLPKSTLSTSPLDILPTLSHMRNPLVASNSNAAINADDNPPNAIGRFLIMLDKDVQKHGLLRGYIRIFLKRPITNVFRAFDDMLSLDQIRPHKRRVPTFYSPRLAQSDVSSQPRPSAPNVISGVIRHSSTRGNPMLVPQTASEHHHSDDGGFGIVVAILVVLVFGAIHLAAWRSSFPSTAERWLWRASSLAITVLPLLMMFGGLISTLLESDATEQEGWSRSRRIWESMSDGIGTTIYIIMILAYMLSRLALLVLPFIQLRKGALDERVFIEVDWVGFFPHVG